MVLLTSNQLGGVGPAVDDALGDEPGEEVLPRGHEVRGHVVLAVLLDQGRGLVRTIPQFQVVFGARVAVKNLRERELLGSSTIEQKKFVVIFLTLNESNMTAR